MRLKLATNLSLPVDVVTEKLAWLGRTGSGKTYGAMKLAELMLAAGAQVGVIDPVGVWRALRVPAQRGGEAFPVYVFGGLYGDLPLEPNPSAAQLVADTVCENHISFVLDVSQWIPSEQQRFVRAFIDRVFHRRKAEPAPMHLFVEECQEFAPQNPQADETMTLHVFQRLWKLGRNFGFGGSLISQRPQEINKKLLNMTGTMFCFQMTGPQEREAVKKWIVDAGAASDIPAKLPRLERGHAYVERVEDDFSAEVAVLPRITADLSSTPKVGQNLAAAKRELSPIDVERVSVALAATIEEHKQNDPKALKQAAKDAGTKVLQLEGALAKAHAELKELRARPPVKVPAIKRADLNRIEKIVSRIDADRAALTGALGPLASSIAALAAAQEPPQMAAPSLANTRDALHEHPGTMPMEPTARLRHLASESAREATATGSLAPGELATLRAVVQFGEITREHLELETGYKRSSRKQYVSRLQQKGLVESTPTHIVATSNGIAAIMALGPMAPLPTGVSLYRWWLERLPAGERKALEAIFAAGPGGMGVHQLEVALNCQKSSRKQYVSRLARRQLVRPAGGRVTASKHLFG